MNPHADDPSGPTRALDDRAPGGSTQVADPARPPAWLSSEQMAIDLTDPAQRRFGDYELIEKIGEGGMGVVYRARQHGLERDVALKLLAAGPGASAEFITRFRREAKSAARMQHPNIVEIHEFGERGGLNYFSMRLIEGESLAERLHREGAMPAQDAARMLRKVAEAMDYAHRLGVLHLDLKPANVLLTRDNEPLVADFGLARRIDASHDGDGGISGTPSYMAPEQAQAPSQPLSASADIYGLGATLYAMLTGRPPFQAGSAQATLERVVTQAPPAPRSIRADIPADLEAICLRSLEKQPGARYPSAHALADDLGRFLDGRPVTARPLSPLQRSVRWMRREPALSGALAAAFAALAIGAAVATVQWRQAEAARELAEERSREATKQRHVAEARAAEMQKAIGLGVVLLADPGRQDREEIDVRAGSAVVWLQDATQGDEALLANVLTAFTRTLVEQIGPGQAQPLMLPILDHVGAPYRDAIARQWEARPDGALVAALWSRQSDPGRTGNLFQGPVAMGDFNRRVRLAAERQPDDPLTLFVSALFCHPPGDCAIPGAAARLARLHPDDAAHWLLAAQEAEADGPDFAALLAHAARASRFDDRTSALFAAYLRGVDEAVTPMPAAIARPMSVVYHADRPAFLQAYVEFQLRPAFPYERLRRYCDPSRLRRRDGARADCIRVARLLADSRGGLLANNVGWALLERLDADAEEAAAGRRAYRWMISHDDVLDIHSRKAESWEQLMRDVAQYGETEAYRLRLERLGHPRMPPEDWRPPASG